MKSRFTFSDIGIGGFIAILGVLGTLVLGVAAIVTIVVSQSQFHMGRKPLHISPTVNILVGEPITQSNYFEKKMIPISVEYIIKNTGKRKVFIAGGAYMLQGVSIANDPKWDFKEKVLKLSKSVIAGYSLFQRFDRTEERSVNLFPLEKKVFAVGTLLAGRDLDPNESVKISEVFFVEENKFDAVNVDSIFYIVNNMKDIWSQPYFFIDESFYGVDICRMTEKSDPPLSCPPLRYYFHIYKKGRPNKNVITKLKRVIYVYESETGTCNTTDDDGNFISRNKGNWCYMAVGDKKNSIKEGKIENKELLKCFKVNCGAEIMPIDLIEELYTETLPHKVILRLEEDKNLLKELEFDVFRDRQSAPLS